MRRELPGPPNKPATKAKTNIIIVVIMPQSYEDFAAFSV